MLVLGDRRFYEVKLIMGYVAIPFFISKIPEEINGHVSVCVSNFAFENKINLKF